MAFAAIIEYCPDLAKIAEARPEHREYLKDPVMANHGLLPA